MKACDWLFLFTQESVVASGSRRILQRFGINFREKPSFEDREEKGKHMRIKLSLKRYRFLFPSLLLPSIFVMKKSLFNLLQISSFP